MTYNVDSITDEATNLTQLTKTVNDFSSYLNSGSQSDSITIFQNFLKAFDKADHRGL